jgi:hypothetical protein
VLQNRTYNDQQHLELEVLKGYLDVVTSSGHIEGWAYDSEDALSAVKVRIVADDGRELGVGTAHGYREDLAAAGHAAGWCAFRIRLTESTGVRTFGLVVADREGHEVILHRQAVPYAVREETPLRSLPELLAGDPTLIDSLDQLRGCNPLFEQFIKTRGPTAFVGAVYVYLLGRPADGSGLNAYQTHLRSKRVSPYELLMTIADSNEYRSRPRYHWAPTAPAFPFRLA